MSLPIMRTHVLLSARSSVLRGVSYSAEAELVSVALVLMRLYWIYDARAGVTRMAFQWCPDVPPRTLPSPCGSVSSALKWGIDPKGCGAIIEGAVLPLSLFSEV